MACWNLFVVGYVFKSVNDSRVSTVLYEFDRQLDCTKTRPHAECRAEYEKATGGYSPWAEFKKAFTPESIAFIELGPPILVGITVPILWGVFAAVRWILRGFGIERKPSGEPRERKGIGDRFRSVGDWLVVPRNLLVASVALVALSVSYYFVIALPATNRERLRFERQAAEAARADREKKESEIAQAAEERKLAFQLCEIEADSSYWSYVKLNGKELPGKAGTYTANMSVWNIADKRKAEALAECHRKHDK
jgi:hypothetical protein